MSDLLAVDPKTRQEVLHIQSRVIEAVPTGVSYASIILALAGLIQTYTETWITADDDQNGDDAGGLDWLDTDPAEDGER